MMDDFLASVATTGRLSAGGQITGAIETGGDADWFSIDLIAGQTYSFILIGADNGGGTLTDPLLRLRNNNGGIVVENDDAAGEDTLDSLIAFTSPFSGRFFLEATSFDVREVGTYRLLAVVATSPPPPPPPTSGDDFAATTATTGRVAVGGSATGTIEIGGDADWFRVDLVAGQSYRFDLAASGAGQGTLGDAFLELRSAAGDVLRVDDDAGLVLDSQITFMADQTGVFFLAARAAGTGTGSYRLSAVDLMDDFAPSAATTGTLSVGGAVTGTIEASIDRDWFRVDLVAGQTYRFDLGGRDSMQGTLADPRLDLRTASGQLLASDNDSGPGFDAQITFTATQSGAFYLDVSAAAEVGTGTYRVSATNISSPVSPPPPPPPTSGDDFAATTATTGRVAIGGSATGTIEIGGDADWFRVDLVAGQAYQVNVSGGQSEGVLQDTFLEIRDAQGVWISGDDDSGPGLDAQFTFIAQQNGAFFLVARSADPQGTGTYRLSINALPSVPADDFAASIATAGRLAIGGSVTGNIEVSLDSDWFAVDVVAGQTYRFNLSGKDGGNGTVEDTFLRLRDASGQVVAEDDDGGLGFDAAMTFTASTTGRVFLESVGIGGGVGSYRLSAALVPANPVDPMGVRSAAPPTDPLFARQWHLNGANGVNVTPVWADYTGAGVRVGIFDQGIDASHRDLDGNYRANLSIESGSGRAGGLPITSEDNHGTAVAGLAAGERNGAGGVGVAYNAGLVSLYDPLDTEPEVFAQAVRTVFTYAIDHVDVLNNSWGFGNFFQSTPNRAFIDNFNTVPFNIAGPALERLAAEGRDGKGTVVVQSAGNTGAFGDDVNVHNFQNSRFVIAVGATDVNGRAAEFTTPGSSVLVSAPGVDILTTDRVDTSGYEAGDSATLSGTSFSSPIVAGVVALMLEANPHLGYRDVQHILALSSRQTDAANASWTLNGAGNWNGGRMHYSETYGFGLVDAKAAVRLAESWVGQRTRANEANLSAQSALATPLAIPDNDPMGVSSTLNLSGDLAINRVEVDLRVDHSFIGDLKITLTSPSGATYALIDRPGQGRGSALGSSQDGVNFTFGLVGFLGEQAAGSWRLNLSDLDPLVSGSLVSWTLRAYGESAVKDDLYVFTDEFAPFLDANPARARLNDTDGGQDILNASAVSGAVAFDLAAGTGAIAGRAISFAGGFERAIGGDGADRLMAAANGSFLSGGRGQDTLSGGDGADRLKGGGGDDRLDAGSGIDVAFYDGAAASYRIDSMADGSLRISGTDGVDMTTGLDVIAFMGQGARLLNAPGIGGYDERIYLAFNPDVAAAVRTGAFASGLDHFNAFGRAEGRFGMDIYDEAFYLARYPDVAAAVRAGALASGLDHWLNFGRSEGRTPNIFFDADYYLQKNPDIAAAVSSGAFASGFDHYVRFGMAEGRDSSPFFNAKGYLDANPDVRAAGVNALTHFLIAGFAEGRLAAIDWDYFG
jgi:subtilisin family serine protease